MQRGWEDCLIESGHLSLSLPSGILTILGCLIHLLTCPNLKPERSGLFFGCCSGQKLLIMEVL